MSANAASLPEGLRIYAVGDIHGRFDLLEALYEQISGDHETTPPQRSVEVFLGDYIDRGPRSRDVVEWMISAKPLSGERICLMGNHEAMLLAALAGPGGMEHWLANGGLATLASYDPAAGRPPAGLTLAAAQGALAEALPESHLAFLSGLPRLVRFGGYLFVHAGLRPGRPIERQDADDLIWIREPFLSSPTDFGCVVVHGHTPADSPEVRPNRINIDTGAVFSGRLACLVLEGESRRFLQTSSR